MISPSSVFSNLLIRFPVVDFPHPDSPTRPNISPFFISKEILSTAILESLDLKKLELPKLFFKFLISSIFSIIFTYLYKHLTRCPSFLSKSSGKISWHLFFAMGHLAAKGHPLSLSDRLGTLPGME